MNYGGECFNCGYNPAKHSTLHIISNGSKWAGEAPDTIDKLLEVLKTETLDPIFATHGSFVSYGLGDMVTVFGNFLTVSHVFNIRGSRKEMQPLECAIYEAMKRPEYIEAAKQMQQKKG